MMTEPSLIHHENIDDVWESLDVTGFSNSSNVSTHLPKHLAEGQNKGRRSWFDSPTPKTLEIAHEVTCDKQSRQTEFKLEDMEVLTLTHFTNPPRIDFGKIKPGVTRRRRLLISNPHDHDQQVVVERVPKKKHFSVDQTEFVVGGEKSLVLTITWRAEEEGPHREMFLFLVDGAYRLQTIVFGHVQAPPQRRRERKGLLGSRIKKPFSVLHTQNFVNIKQSYTPRRPSLKDNVVLTGFNKQKSGSQSESENIAPDPAISVLDNTQMVSVISSAEDASDVSSVSIVTTPIQPVKVSENQNSVRRSRTYTKLGLTSDTPDRRVVLDSQTRSVTTVTVNTHPNPTSDTKNCMFLEEACINFQTEAPVQKLDHVDLNSTEVSESPRLTGCTTTPKHTDRSLLTQSHISPNTFLRENLAASSTPSNPHLDDISVFRGTCLSRSSEKSTFTKVKNVNSKVCITEMTQTVETRHTETTQNTFNVTPTMNRGAKMKSIVQVSPLSFLRESLSNTPDHGNVSISSDSIPSPGLVLNNSVPHEIVVRQLGSVRKSLSCTPTGWQPSPIVNSPSLQLFIPIEKKEKNNRRSTSSVGTAVVKTKSNRRRSEAICSNKNKLFKEIPETLTQSPRRSTFVKKSKNIGKSCLVPDKKTSSKVTGKFKSTVTKTKPKMEARRSISPRQDLRNIKFSPKNSAESVSTPLPIPNDTNLARYTMVVKNPKFSPKNSTEAVSTPLPVPDDANLARYTMVVKNPKFSPKNSTEAVSTPLPVPDDANLARYTMVVKNPKFSPKNSVEAVSTPLPVPDDANLARFTMVVKNPKFSPKNSAEAISTPLPVPNDANLARYTMVVKNPKVFVPNSSDQDSTEIKPNSKNRGNKNTIDSSTVVKSKVESIKQATVSAANKIQTNEKSPRELFPKSPSEDSPRDSTFLTDIAFGTPVPLPTSPHPDMSRRATLTITKAKPSKTLLKSTLAGKALFEGNQSLEDNHLSLCTQSSSSRAEKLHTDELLQGIQSTPTENTVESVNPRINLSSGLAKISEDYLSNADSASSADVSPELENSTNKVSPSIDKKQTFLCQESRKIPTSTHEDSMESKSQKVSPGIDHTETFVTLVDFDENIKDTPIRGQIAFENCQPRKGRMKRQLAQSQIVTGQNKMVAVPVERKVVPTQKKRYHSDSSAVLSRSKLEQEEKRQKITDASQPYTKGRIRRATDSSIRSGSKKGCNKMTGQPAVAQSRLVLVKKGHTALPKHPMPFAAKNIYYDERWIEKQERGFVKWLNFILTPPEECQTKAEKVKGSVNLDPKMSVQRLAPTKEVLSLRAYTARRRMNRLRRAACRIYQSEEVIKVIHKIESEVESYRLVVRKDRMVHADVGIKQKVLDLILSYNSLWLRIGLETIYGEIIMLQSNSDVIGLSRFILTRLLGNPDIAMEFSHHTVPHLYREGYQEAVSKHVLKKYMMLIYFLDMAKRMRLIDHDPCLFCKNADWKSSKELLFQFSKDYLSGEGDITRHLGFLGYTVSHVQLPLDEFDYAVTNLATDLKDGLRLTRVVELLTQTWDLCRLLRVPAISRLQKVHNMELTFKSLTQHSHITDPSDGGKVSSRDIVEGHREKTLALLWNIIINFQVDVLIDEAKLQEEINVLNKCLRVRKLWDKLQDDGNSIGKSPGETDILMDIQICQNNRKLRLLLTWARAVCAFYNFKVENFTVSFSDGRGFCYLVHHYYPGLLPLSDIQSETSMMFHDQSPDMDDSFSSPMIQMVGSGSSETDNYYKLINNEKENFRVLYEKVSELGGVPLMLKSLDMSNTIPDERVVITYLAHLCSRLLDVQQEMNAARVIQIAWRRHQIRQQQQQILTRTKAASCIQSRVREFLCDRRIKRQNKAIVRLQTAWRAYQARSVLKLMKWEKENGEKLRAVTTLQRAVRGFLDLRRYQRLKRNVVTLQALARGHLVRRQIRQEKSARKIQEFYRGWKQMRIEVDKYAKIKRAVRVLQIVVRRKRDSVKQMKALVVIQASWKSTLQRKRYLQIRKSAIMLQSRVRMVLSRNKYQVLRQQTLNLQRRYRALVAMETEKQKFAVIKKSAIVIQTAWRGHVLRKKYERIQQAVIVLQSNFRAYKSRTKFRALRLATIIVQRQFRAQVQMKKCRQDYLTLINRREKSAIIIQRSFQGYSTRRNFLRTREAAIVIQSAYRGYKVRRLCRNIRNSLLIIQQAVRRYNLRRQNENVLKSKAATTLQSTWKMYKERRGFLVKRRSAQIIQSAFRVFLCRLKFVKLRESAVTIQRRYRAFKLGEDVRLEMDVMIGAAVTVQVAWKRYCAMCHYKMLKSSAVLIQKWWRTTTQRKRFIEIRNATKIIQEHFRNYIHSKDVREKYCRLKSAAICLQKACRRRQLLVRHVILIQAKRRGLIKRREFLKKKEAAAVLQRSYRSYLLKKEEKLIHLRRSVAAILIQSKWRGYALCRDYKKARKATISIQVKLKCFLERRRYLKLRQSVITLQRQVKVHLSGRKQRSEYLKLKSATLVLQSGFRAWKVRKLFQAKRSAIIVIQRKLRETLAHRRLIECSLVIQRVFRSSQAMKTERKVFLWKKSAIILIQRKLRETLAHRRLIESSIVIQRAFRSSQAMKTERKMFLKKKSAVCALQFAWRNYQIRKASHKLTCVVKFQSAVRKYLDQKRYHAKREACVRLQAEWRRYRCQRDFANLQKAVVSIQTRYRAMKAARQQHQEYQRIRNSVINIQAFSRGFLVRKQIQQKHEAAVKIQSCWRHFHLQKEFNLRTEAAIVVQRWYRCQKLGKSQQKHYQNMKTAAVKIQTAYRRLQARQNFVTLKNYCITIQKYCRGSHQRKHYRKLKMSAIVLQSKVRAHQKMVRERQQFLKVKSAIVCLQSAFKQKKRRQELKLNKSATIIQSAFKGYTERKRFLKQKQSVILIQAVYRGFSERSKYQKLWWASMTIKRWWLQTKLNLRQKQELRQQREHVRCCEAAAKIQIWFKEACIARAQRKQFLLVHSSVLNLQRLTRGYLVRKFVSRIKAAITIQKNFRRHCARLSFVQQRRAAIVIQSWLRQNQSKRLLAKRRFAIHILQRNIRAYLFCSRVRQAAQLREISARKIQTWYRYLIAELHERRFNAAVRLQAYFRGRVERRGYIRLRWATVVIQRGFRHQQALRAYHYLQQIYARHRQSVVAEFVLRARRELSAIVLQRAVRRHHLLTEAKKHLHCVLIIQHWIRGRLERLRYLNTILAVKRIQRCTRRWLDRRQTAAMVIQKAVCDWLQRQRVERRLKAVVRLQACWRGQMTRRRNSKKVKQMRLRLSEVNAAATEEKKLGHRTTSALDYLLRYKQLAYILDALMHLEVVTRLSGECCLIIVEGNAVGVIYTLIRSCNRSLPHMELIKYSVAILLNLAKFDRTIHAVYKSEESISTLVELMQIYRDKGAIFSKTCTLLGILALNHRRRQEILQDHKLVEKVRSIQCLTARKQKIEDTRITTKNKLIAVKTSFNCSLLPATPSKRFPKVRPDWLLRRDSLKVFENPLCAINFVMESLQLTPKK